MKITITNPNDHDIKVLIRGSAPEAAEAGGDTGVDEFTLKQGNFVTVDADKIAGIRDMTPVTGGALDFSYAAGGH